jgi:GNAT superfamily N-acetyltransferase
VITYRTDKSVDLETFIDVYRRSTLGERRPIQNRGIMAAMLEHADVLITAWEGQLLVGLARTLTDFEYVAYLADLAVDEAYQRRGIGRELILRTQAALEPSCFITLLAAPKANDYYPKVGFHDNPRAWMLPARTDA